VALVALAALEVPASTRLFRFLWITRAFFRAAQEVVAVRGVLVARVAPAAVVAEVVAAMVATPTARLRL
jgi:hypothetical protein